MHTVRRPDQPFCADVLHGTALPEMLASRLLPEQVEQEAAWKAAMPGGLQQLVTEPRLCLEYANNLVRGCSSCNFNMTMTAVLCLQHC